MDEGMFVGDSIYWKEMDIYTFQIGVQIVDPKKKIPIGVIEVRLFMGPSQTAEAWHGRVQGGSILLIDESADYGLVTDSADMERHKAETIEWTEAEQSAREKLMEGDDFGYVIEGDQIVAYSKWLGDQEAMISKYFGLPGQPSLGWAFMVQQPTDIALAPFEKLDAEAGTIFDDIEETSDDLVDNTRNTISFISTFLAVVLFAALFLAFWLGRGITRPITRLYQGVLEVMGGNLDHRVGSEGEDEISQLSLAFDEMTTTVKRSHQELEEYSSTLEEKVADRTKELQQEAGVRKRAEEEMKITVEKLNTILESIEDGIFVINLIGDIMDVNGAYLNMLGYTQKEDILGKPFVDTVAEKDRERIGETVTKAIETEDWSGRIGFTVISNHDEEIEVEMSSSPLRDGFGDLMGFVSVVRDVTERNQMERRAREQTSMLIQSEKMSSVGTMVAGVTHELNNPLTGIINYGQHCLKHTEKDDRRYTVLEDIVKEAKRCTEIVRNMLSFSRKEAEGEEGYQKASIIELVDRTLSLLAYRVRADHVSITQSFPDDMPDISMKPNSIEQILLNLIGNAMDALHERETKEIRIEGSFDEWFVEVRVIDNGPGISSEVMQKLFEPFFTTKPVGKGTGLGLSISHSICKQHGGDLICESEMGVGTTFKIRLPIDRESIN